MQEIMKNIDDLNNKNDILQYWPQIRNFWKNNTSTLVSLFDTLKNWKIIDSKLDNLSSRIIW